MFCERMRCPQSSLGQPVDLFINRQGLAQVAFAELGIGKTLAEVQHVKVCVPLMREAACLALSKAVEYERIRLYR